MSPRQPLIHNQPQNPEGRVKVVLVLRQGTGLALSISILPPGCSQKKVASLMNTSRQIIRCYEVTSEGIRAVKASRDRCRITPLLFFKIENARKHFARSYRPVKPRVAPRLAVGVVIAQGVAHAHA